MILKASFHKILICQNIILLTKICEINGEFCLQSLLELNLSTRLALKGC